MMQQVPWIYGHGHAQEEHERRRIAGAASGCHGMSPNTHSPLIGASIRLFPRIHARASHALQDRGKAWDPAYVAQQTVRAADAGTRDVRATC